MIRLTVVFTTSSVCQWTMQLDMGVKKVRRSADFLWQRQDDFYNDRPVLATHNSSIRNLSTLLVDEITELNGHTADGLTLEEYREQEIADIGWFTISFAHMLKIQLDDKALQIIAESEPSRDIDQPWGPDDERKYHEIKTKMELAAQRLNENPYIIGDDLEEARNNSHEIQPILSEIMQYAAELVKFIGTELSTAMMEKLARNHLKHAPRFYDGSFGDYNESKRAASIDWTEKNGNPLFYGTAEGNLR